MRVGLATTYIMRDETVASKFRSQVLSLCIFASDISIYSSDKSPESDAMDSIKAHDCISSHKNLACSCWRVFHDANISKNAVILLNDFFVHERAQSMGRLRRRCHHSSSMV